jgi:glycosyltransferase involved in cell wall biosynthesis
MTAGPESGSIMTVSIIICTRSRADSLKLTLESIGRVIVPPGWEAELVIVDNGSTDSTKALVTSTTLPNLPIRYIWEGRKGKGFAYNTGMAAAQGQVFLFTDDDVRVPVNWIEGMCRPILDGAAYAVVGAVIFPPGIADTLSQAPFSSRRSWFASTEELDRHSPNRMVGANMAFHRQVLDRVPGFDIKLGPGALGFHDETLFSWQLLAAGYKLVGAFDVIVEHHFDTSRLTRQGLIDIAHKMGCSQAFVFHHWEHQTSRFSFPRLILSHLRRYLMRCRDRMKGKACLVSLQTLHAEQLMAFYREYLAQRRYERKYASRSLVPPMVQAQPSLPGNGNQRAGISVSIIVCTRNRAESLKLTLESIANVVIPPGWNTELLVIDNGSTDHTQTVVNAAKFSNITLQYVYEPKAGVSNARNTGLKQAAGQIVVFTDDDIRVPLNWVEGMCRPIFDGTAYAVQGGIRPAPYLERPWLTGMLRIWLAAVEDPVYPPEGLLVGANMSLDREAIEITGGFDPRLGPGAAGFYDDTMFGLMLRRAGKKISYQPAISVEHHFEPSRLKLGSFIRIAQRMAVSRAIMMQTLNPESFPHPSLLDLLLGLPALGARCVTQLIRFLANRSPDAAFLSHYYRLHLWMALRKKDRTLKAPDAVQRALAKSGQ